MTEQPQTKCSSCGCSIPQNKDDLPNTGLCDRCKNSSETQEWFKRQREKNTPATLEGVKAVFRKWLFIGADDEVIDVIMACAIDRKLSGDPLWLFLISPSGGTKTEIVRSLQNDDIYTLDSLTAHTLISGKTSKNENGEVAPVIGILKQIDGKVLVIKDFTVILNKRREDRDEIFSQLRSLYDGYIEFAFGTSPAPIRINAQIGLIAACTPAIDAYAKLYLQLGERFLKIRHHPDSDKATTQALQNLGKETEMREELAQVAARLLNSIKEGFEVKPISEENQTAIKQIAQSVAILRTPVSINFWRYEVNEAAQPSIEYPTRLAKQLLKLAYALAVIRGNSQVTDAEMNTVKRVARDTCVPNRIRILAAMGSTAEKYMTRQLAREAGIPLSTCWRELKELEYLGVVEYERIEEGYRHLPEKDGWRLLDVTLLNILPSEKKPELSRFIVVPPEGIEGKENKGVVVGDGSETDPKSDFISLDVLAKNTSKLPFD